MDRREAEDIIARIVAGEIPLDRTRHFLEEMWRDGYVDPDVHAIPRTHVIQPAPMWDEKHQNFRLRLLGKCLRGGMTRLVLGLRRDGPQVAITIMPVRFIKPQRTWRK